MVLAGVLDNVIKIARDTGENREHGPRRRCGRRVREGIPEAFQDTTDLVAYGLADNNILLFEIDPGTGKSVFII